MLNKKTSDACFAPGITNNLFHLQKNLTNSSYCVYWDSEANDGYGNWSTNGCYNNETVNGRIVCLCNHLTNFAILTVSVSMQMHQ